MIGGIPVIIEGGGSLGVRTDNTGTYESSSVFFHVGPGIDIGGVGQIHIGVQAGSNVGLYLEGELLGRDCGLKIAYLDTGIYFPGGEVGVTSENYVSHWILTREEFVFDAGGYNQFGRRYAFPEGFDSYYILKEGYDKDALKYWWIANRYNRLYTLEEKP